VPLNPPVPVKATDIALACQIDFDRPLVPGVLNLANWSVRHSNTRYAMFDAGVGPFQPESVVIHYIPPGVPDPGPDVVTYSPPPFDVVGDPDLVPAAAFTDFPITP